jgi:hypothetical protein
MIEVFNGLNALFTQTPPPAFNTAVGGRFWLIRAPQTTAYPYCVFSLASNIPGYTFNTQFAELLVQFSIFDKAADNSSRGSAILMDAQSKLWSLYDFSQPIISGYSTTIMRRARNMILTDSETGVLHSMTQYYLRISK